MQSYIIDTDGRKREVIPSNGKYFTHFEVNSLLDSNGDLKVVTTLVGEYMIMNNNDHTGKVNVKASLMHIQSETRVFGKVLITTKKLFKLFSDC